MKIESYPKPLLPLSSSMILPSHFPSKYSVFSPEKEQIIVLNLASKFFLSDCFSKEITFSRFLASLRGSPAKIAESTPGKPHSSSISKPESSAIVGIFVIAKSPDAFKKAFSLKVLPLSSISILLGKSSFIIKSSIFSIWNSLKICKNSLFLCSLFVASRSDSFFIFFNQ